MRRRATDRPVFAPSFMRAALAIIALLPLHAAAVQAGSADAEERALYADAVRQPHDFGANRRLARFFLRENQVAMALPWLEKARAADPSDYDNSYDLALARLETKDIAGARSVVEYLLKLQDRAELHNLLGDVEEAAGNFDIAARQYEAAVRMDPSEKNLFDLGTDLLRHKASQQALIVFRYAAPLFPRSPRIQIGLGIALYSSGQYSEAVEVLCRAVDLDPVDTRALGFLGGMYDVAPELSDEVTRRLEHFAQLYPRNAAANYWYALSLRRRTLGPGPGGNEKKAEELLHRAVTLDPKFADAHFQLGLLYADEEKVSEAIHEFEIAVRLNPELKSAHYRLSRLYAEAGRSDLAQRELQVFRALKGNQ